MAARARGGTRAVVGERGLPVERRGRWATRLALPRDTPRVQVEEIQRSRLLAAAAVTFDEVGYEQTSVQRVTDRARVSRRTFYELFENREECLVALLDEAVERVERELLAAGLDGLSWRERVRGGLWVILSFLEREPVLARICVVQALHGGPRVLERREEILARLAGVLDEGRREGARGEECTLVTAEGLVGGAFGVVYARLRGGDQRPLTGLLDELMGMIVLQYLGPRAARREQQRPAPALRPAPEGGRSSVGAEKDPLDEVDMRLTYRTAKVLQCIAEPGGQGSGPSNRAVAESAGVTDPGQISKLLRRLEGLGLVVNTGGGHLSGEPNAWELTPLGRQVAQRLSVLTLERESRDAPPDLQLNSTRQHACVAPRHRASRLNSQEEK
jgi:AcrR family transcriptional regulator/DNA-binding MarR family transcriptional regulator